VLTATDGEAGYALLKVGPDRCFVSYRPGTYKAVMEMNAGPLAPELRTEVEFTVR